MSNPPVRAVESLPPAEAPIPTATPPPTTEKTLDVLGSQTQETQRTQQTQSASASESSAIPRSPQPQPAPNKESAPSGPQVSGSLRKSGSRASAQRGVGVKDRQGVGLPAAAPPAKAGLPAARGTAQARGQATAIAKEQGTRWAEERRRELAEAQTRSLPAAGGTAQAGLPAAAQAGGAGAHGTGGSVENRGEEMTAGTVGPQMSSQAGSGANRDAGTPQASQDLGVVGPMTAAAAPPGQPVEGVQSSQPGPASSGQVAGNQIGGLASPLQTLPPVSTPTYSPETFVQAPSVPKEEIPGVAIQIERPQPGTTHQGVQALVGRIVGGTTNEVVVHLNESQQLLDVWGNTFEGEVNLRPGNNQLRVVAMGPRGPIAERSIEIRYVPPPPAWGVRVLRPANGTVLDSPGQDLIEVEGEVSEPGTQEARVTFNEFAIPVPVKDGRFSTIVPVLSPEVTIRAEVRGGGGTLSSDPVVIRRQPFKASKGYLMLYLPTPTRKVETRLWLLHRPSPSDVNTPRKVTSHFPSEAPGIERESTIFAFPAVQEGVYTLAADYRVAPGESVEKGWGLVFVPGPSGYRSLRLGPFQLTGKGRVTVSKFILPYGIFWEEDFWFSGTAEGSDTVTKFRHPDGISWTEKKGDPEFPTTK